MRRIFRVIILAAALTLVACGGTPSGASPNPVEVTATAPTVNAAPVQTQARPRFIDFYATW